MNKIYTIAVKFSYDYYLKKYFKYKFTTQKIDYYWGTPIFAKNKEEAIEIFNKRYAVDKCDIFLWEGKAKNIYKDVVCIGNKEYTIKELQNKMESNDFLHYCRQELGLEEIENILTSK